MTIPKSLYGMTEEKALGSIKWTRKILGKKYPCFIYCPENSIFDKDGFQNKLKIESLVKKFNGVIRK